jgi:hypothetical protein
VTLFLHHSEGNERQARVERTTGEVCVGDATTTRSANANDRSNEM